MSSLTVGQWFRNVHDGVVSTFKGMSITLKYVYSEKEVTVQYPEEREVLPEASRSRLYNDVLNCTSCRQCLNICPVNCIRIVADRMEKDAPKVSSECGAPIRFELKDYTIDTGLCCYCGLCTTVCPTECITHTTDFEYSQDHLDGFEYDYTSEELRSWRDRLVIAKREDPNVSSMALKKAEISKKKEAAKAAAALKTEED